MSWFVMLNTQRGGPPPMIDDKLSDEWTDVVALFESERAAEDAGAGSAFGAVYGFEVYEWPR